MGSALSLRQVTKEYTENDGTTITAVRGADLELASGEFAIVIGRSGSGKTTLLNLIAGLARPTSGKVFAEGVDVGRLGDGELSALRNHVFGFVFQFPSLLPSLNALENVALPAHLSHGDGGKARSRAAELLAQVGLSGRLGSHPRQLSAGEQRRVVIARALMNQPEILLADEPTSDLDERTESEVLAVFKEVHRSGVTVVMVTHALDLVSYGSRTFRMEGGVLSESRLL